MHRYTSALTGSTYVLNTTAASSHAAEAACNDLADGAHLVSYISPDEEYDVETYFTNAGGCAGAGLRGGCSRAAGAGVHSLLGTARLTPVPPAGPAGVLLPRYHGAYWLGLEIPQSDPNIWPRFRWRDGSPAPFNPAEELGEYAHWGFGSYGDGARCAAGGGRGRARRLAWLLTLLPLPALDLAAPALARRC